MGAKLAVSGLVWAKSKRLKILYVLTIDIEFHGPTVLPLAHRVAGHTLVTSLVLLSHRTDKQCRSVLGEVVSVTGTEWDVIP